MNNGVKINFYMARSYGESGRLRVHELFLGVHSGGMAFNDPSVVSYQGHLIGKYEDTVFLDIEPGDKWVILHRRLPSAPPSIVELTNIQRDFENQVKRCRDTCYEFGSLVVGLEARRVLSEIEAQAIDMGLIKARRIR